VSAPASRRTPSSRLLAADVVRAGTVGLRYRRARALLSALGIAIGIAALVLVLGIARSSESALLAEIDRLGTNLLAVTNGQTLQGQEAELPAYAAAMIQRVPGVEHAAPRSACAGHSARPGATSPPSSSPRPSSSAPSAGQPAC